MALSCYLSANEPFLFNDGETQSISPVEDPSFTMNDNSKKMDEPTMKAEIQHIVDEFGNIMRYYSSNTAAETTRPPHEHDSKEKHLLTRPLQRKLSNLVQVSLGEANSGSRLARLARSLGERIAHEMLVSWQPPHEMTQRLWAAVRARGCQFLGPAVQEEALRLILLALEDGSSLSRKVLVLFVVQKLAGKYPKVSKTSVGHVVQLLYRASCFKLEKRDAESSLMQLKDELRNYDALRRQHDAQLVQIAQEAGVRLSPEHWSSLLYGDLAHKSHMQSIIDKMQTPASFLQAVDELTALLARSEIPEEVHALREELDLLANVDPASERAAWEDVLRFLSAAQRSLRAWISLQLTEWMPRSLHESSHNLWYKTSLCRDFQLHKRCPRGDACNFAHSRDELERFRARSKKLLRQRDEARKDGSLELSPDEENQQAMFDMLDSGKPPLLHRSPSFDPTGDPVVPFTDGIAVPAFGPISRTKKGGPFNSAGMPSNYVPQGGDMMPCLPWSLNEDYDFELARQVQCMELGQALIVPPMGMPLTDVELAKQLQREEWNRFCKEQDMLKMHSEGIRQVAEIAQEEAVEERKYAR